MAISARTLKWIIRFYPPLLFQRIWVIAFRSDWRGVSVRINKSFLNRNYNRSIFGGTMFAAADPFYPILFYQYFTQKGYKVIVWMKSAEVQYLKPGMTNLTFSIYLDDDTLARAEQIISSDGKYIETLPIELFDKSNELCAVVNCEVYVRNLNIPKNP